MHFNRLDRSSFHQWPKINDSAAGAGTWEMQSALRLQRARCMFNMLMQSSYITFIESCGGVQEQAMAVLKCKFLALIAGMKRVEEVL